MFVVMSPNVQLWTRCTKEEGGGVRVRVCVCVCVCVRACVCVCVY